MQTILYVKGNESYQNRRKLAGVASFARERHWNLQPVKAIATAAEADRVCRLWQPDGIIANVTPPPVHRFFSEYAAAPAIFFQTPVPSANCIWCDSQAIAECAARELLSLNLSAYAYVPWKENLSWSLLRQKTFASAVALHGHRAQILEIRAGKHSDVRLASQIAKWLVPLPKPLGVFAANDDIARLIIAACHVAHLAVPDDVAVIGVDDDDVCDNCTPTLSSVAFDYFAAGRTAARTIERLITGKVRQPVSISYAPLGVIRRQSTRRLPTKDAAVFAALERIRREACEGLTAADVLTHFDCSRRLAEMRFRRAVGRSILEEIRTVRLEKAQALLLEGHHKLEYVANVCGYKTLAAFSTFFRAETGVPPSLWRRRSASRITSG